MSARPGDWSLLQLSGDPFPGDENAVARQAGHYQTVAEAITDQISNLRKISHGNAQGLYVDKLTDDTKDIANDLSKVHNRFDTVASQLKVWQPVLADARTTSAKLLREAETAHSSMSANHPPDKPLADDATDAQVNAEKSRSKNYSAAQTELNGYVRQMQTEIEHVRSVARRVAGKINDASSDDVEDSWWDAHVRKWIQDHAHLIDIIVKVLEIAAIVIAVVALVLVTGGFGAFAALGIAGAWVGTAATVAEVAGVVLGGALLLGHAAEMDAGVNDVGWGTIAMDVISLATFGAGKVLTKSLSSSVKLAESSAVQRTTTSALENLPSTVKNALKIGDETNPLRVWAAGEASSAVSSAQRSLARTLEVTPRTSLILLTGDREIAEMATKLRVLEGVPASAIRLGNTFPLVRGLAATTNYEHLHLAYDLTKLPGELKELVGGESEKGGG